jgi:aspartate carbamoyltransferase regulatory subunit
MNLTKQYAVSAICNGTVIDHIHAGSALRIIKLLRLAEHEKMVTLGLNLPSKRLGLKDLIKVEERKLDPDEVNQVALFAPNATISIIENYEVIQKYPIALPDTINSVIPCPNPRCISNHEKIPSYLYVIQKMDQSVRLRCHYCRKSISQEEIKQ